MAPFAADFGWASTDAVPLTTPSPASAHPTFEALDSARKATVFGITQLLVDEIDAQSDAIEAEALAAMRRSEQWGRGRSWRSRPVRWPWRGCSARLRRSMATSIAAAETNPLTGALNRLGLRHAAAPWFADRAHAPVALAVVDLDHFKAVNDTHGHEAGDEVLRSVASRLTTATMADHTVVSRWGGDEFVVAFRFPDGLPDGAVDRISARLLARLAEPVELADTVRQCDRHHGHRHLPVRRVRPRRPVPRR